MNDAGAATTAGSLNASADIAATELIASPSTTNFIEGGLQLLGGAVLLAGAGVEALNLYTASQRFAHAPTTRAKIEAVASIACSAISGCAKLGTSALSIGVGLGNLGVVQAASFFAPAVVLLTPAVGGIAIFDGARDVASGIANGDAGTGLTGVSKVVGGGLLLASIAFPPLLIVGMTVLTMVAAHGLYKWCAHRWWGQKA